MEKLTKKSRSLVGNPLFDLLVFILIVISIVLLGLEIALPHDHDQYHNIEFASDLITGIFVLELALRLFASRRKSRFFREYFIDILAVMPILRPFRVLRFLRLLRILRLFRGATLLIRQTRLLQWLFRQRATEYVLTVVFLLFATLFGTLGLSHFRDPSEASISGYSGTEIIIHSFWETIFSIVAGEWVDEFPITFGGKVIILFVQFCGLTFFALLTGTISAVMIDKLKEGTVLNQVMIEDLEDHILICGYNAGVETIVAEFQNHIQFKDREILIITQAKENPILDIPFPTRVRYINEDFTRVDVLRNCNIDACSVAVIVSDTTGGRSRQDADARTVLAALTIEKLNPDVHTCAELSDAYSESHLRMGGVNEVIVTRSLSGHLLAQAALYSSNVHLLQELLRPTEGQTFKPTAAIPAYNGMNFSEVLAKHHREEGSIPVAVQKSDGEVILNPKDYVLAEGDRLICISPHQS